MGKDTKIMKQGAGATVLQQDAEAALIARTLGLVNACARKGNGVNYGTVAQRLGVCPGDAKGVLDKLVEEGALAQSGVWYNPTRQFNDVYAKYI